ncbi:uncharacterized protein LOC141876458 [Acropora palmata]|uniref:uncharacterized protein LOC141876458 n=1 Tax=Acropora palmata TaxID=6131 RepID=UPI003DA09C82
MASAQVVEMSVANNSPSQDSSHSDDLFQSRYVTPGFKPCSYLMNLLHIHFSPLYIARKFQEPSLLQVKDTCTDLGLLGVWDPPQVLFNEHGTEATDMDVKAREKSAVKLFATCQLCSVGGRDISDVFSTLTRIFTFNGIIMILARPQDSF